MTIKSYTEDQFKLEWSSSTSSSSESADKNQISQSSNCNSGIIKFLSQTDTLLLSYFGRFLNNHTLSCISGANRRFDVIFNKELKQRFKKLASPDVLNIFGLEYIYRQLSNTWISNTKDHMRFVLNKARFVYDVLDLDQRMKSNNINKAVVKVTTGYDSTFQFGFAIRYTNSVANVVSSRILIIFGETINDQNNWVGGWYENEAKKEFAINNVNATRWIGFISDTTYVSLQKLVSGKTVKNLIGAHPKVYPLDHPAKPDITNRLATR